MLGMANIYHTDGDLERDIKFDAWIDRRKYHITNAVDLEPVRTWARENGIEVLIIKE